MIAKAFCVLVFRLPATFSHCFDRCHPDIQQFSINSHKRTLSAHVSVVKSMNHTDDRSSAGDVFHVLLSPFCEAVGDLYLADHVTGPYNHPQHSLDDVKMVELWAPWTPAAPLAEPRLSISWWIGDKSVLSLYGFVNWSRSIQLLLPCETIRRNPFGDQSWFWWRSISGMCQRSASWATGINIWWKGEFYCVCPIPLLSISC